MHAPEDASFSQGDWTGRTFQTTHWSVVLRVSNEHSGEGMQALEELCLTYWYPLYAFVRRKGSTHEQAQDLTQEFFAKLLEKNQLSLADPEQVSGTIGQPDGGPRGNFSLAGGFWSLLSVVQTPGAPTLSISRSTPGNAIVSWNPNTSGFVLQETWSLSPANWTNSLSGATNPVTVPACGAKYFRLIKTN